MLIAGPDYNGPLRKVVIIEYERVTFTCTSFVTAELVSLYEQQYS